jgi:DNA-binding NtrC family response regulator
MNPRPHDQLARALDHAVKSAFVMPGGQDDAHHAAPILEFAVGTRLEEIERAVILSTLDHCGGRKREAARLLGVSLKTLYNRLHDYRSR